MTAKWYVFDEADCFDNFETVEAAAIHAKWMQDHGGFHGIHICLMTQVEFDHYAMYDDLRAAYKRKM